MHTRGALALRSPTSGVPVAQWQTSPERTPLTQSHRAGAPQPARPRLLPAPTDSIYDNSLAPARPDGSFGRSAVENQN
eukprot:3540813-Pleurochrysis_carterae.AAC.2